MRSVGPFDRSLLKAQEPHLLEKAPLSLKEIRDSIPAHLFEFNPWLSVYYIARDLVQVALTCLVTWFLLEHTTHWALRGAIWVAYGAVQGTTCFGIWVIAHECGHQAYFGKHASINDAVGYFLHTALLVPYHNWRISHGTHHRYTNNREKDTAFPDLDQPYFYWELLNLFPPVIVVNFVSYLVLGWVSYLFFNQEGNPFNGESHINHFSPSSPYFKPSERHLIIGSNFGIVAVLAILGVAASQFSLGSVLCWYGSAWLVCHMWLVLVTFLQHTDERTPHYANADWDFVRGALSTIDRDYGVFNNWLHHITNGHIVHHLFSTMPFYNAIQATPYVKKALGKYYLHDERPMYLQIFHSWFAHQASFQNHPDWVKKNGAGAKKSSVPSCTATVTATAAPPSPTKKSAARPVDRSNTKRSPAKQ